jgi:hypothetical protein
MPYSAEINRANPTSILFLIDQSGSMADSFGGQPERKKSEGVADAINRLLHNLVLRSTKSDGVRDYFHVGVIGYGNSVAPAFGGELAGRDLIPLSEVGDHPIRVEQRTRKVEDNAGGLVDQTVRFPIWFEPQAQSGTPMVRALQLARTTVEGFLSRNPSCFPPIVINITDGESTDGDPEAAAAALRGLNSGDGNVLLFNAHISSRPGQPIEFPDREDVLPDAAARLLFRMSSPLPPLFQAAATAEGLASGEATRGFVFNGDLVAVIRFLDIGTRVAQNLR